MGFDVRRLTGLVATAIALLPVSPLSQGRIEVFRLAPDSPLATDGSSIFGIATDRRTLLVSGGSGSDWRVLSRHPTPFRVSGLAWNRGMLYLSDEQAKAIFRIPIDIVARKAAQQAPNSDLRGEPAYEVGLRRPRDLAFTDGLLVADPDAGTVYRIDSETGKPVPFAAAIPPGEIGLAADRRTVVITSPRVGEVRFPSPFTSSKSPSPGELRIWRTRTDTARSGGVSESPAVARRRFQPIQNPTAPALTHGSLYLIDETDGSVYVTFRQHDRPIPISQFTATKRPTRLLPLGDSLMVLDGVRGVLERWPLPVPTQIELGENPDRALDGLVSYLQSRGALPVRTVPLQGSIEDTLRREGLTSGAVGQGLRAVVCELNRSVCANGAPTAPATPVGLRIPDIPIESAVDLGTLAPEDLGEGTLGQKVDQRLATAEFRPYGSSTELWELNASRLVALDTTRSRQTTRESWGPYTYETIRDLRRRDLPSGFRLTIPVETVRAFVAVPRSVWRDDERLSAIRLLSAGFNWNLLEDVEGKAQDAQPQPPASAPPVPCDFVMLGNQRKDLRTTVHYPALMPELPSVNVGVVEFGTVDVQHPAFGPDYGALQFVPPQVPPSPSAAPPSAPDCGVPWNRDPDHATAVAALIAGHTPGLAGFAPNARVVVLSGNDDLVGQEILNAYRSRHVRIFNLSLHYDAKLTTNIRLKINDLRTALFVVAAGNDVTDSKPVCESATPYPAYPVCDGYRKNVLVVAATGLDGKALIDIDRESSPPAPGSNWNEEIVHIAAPGTGFSAPARDNTFKAVRGTSFAAPLVTATAAMLFAEGVTDPWLIKQRIIATADNRDNLIGKVYGAGLLNVERAIKEPKHGVLSYTEKDPNTLRDKVVERIVDMEPGNITISWETKSGGSRTLPLSAVRRLTRSPGGGSYRIIYLDDVTDSLVVQDEIATGNWPVEYRLVDPRTGAPSGNKIKAYLENFKDYIGAIIF